jgi:hypothetical protein
MRLCLAVRHSIHSVDRAMLSSISVGNYLRLEFLLCSACYFLQELEGPAIHCIALIVLIAHQYNNYCSPRQVYIRAPISTSSSIKALPT